ncbi:hypothetical protein L6452_44364 [Arctium lappa]|uniref:Uncharacterized protein n=1 Tax=Arctium lappa TaxID=4217 RepID=A0ACB8XFX3_ARCLA|nr:hypothetical protein L6452_44364 [Arctium lappa]
MSSTQDTLLESRLGLFSASKLIKQNLEADVADSVCKQRILLQGRLGRSNCEQEILTRSYKESFLQGQGDIGTNYEEALSNSGQESVRGTLETKGGYLST